MSFKTILSDQNTIRIGRFYFCLPHIELTIIYPTNGTSSIQNTIRIMQCHHDYITFVTEVIYVIAEKIKVLREQNNLTQTQLAKTLGISRSAVNAYEQSISVPSTQYIVELARLFKISTDYLLGLDSTSTVSISGLSEKDVEVVYTLIQHLRGNNKPDR